MASLNAAQAYAPSPRLGEILVDEGALAEPDLERALRVQVQQSGAERLGGILVKLGLVSERQVVGCLAGQLHVPLASSEQFPDQLFLEDQVSSKFLKDSRALIVGVDERTLNVVMENPGDRFVIESLRMISGKEVQVSIGLPSEIERIQKALFEAAEEEAKGGAEAQFSHDIEHLKELASEAPVIKQLNQILQRAAEQGASDIHIEPFTNQLRVRYRIDGVLRESDTLTAEYGPAVISRVKIMANLDIAERRLPQDGRFHIRQNGRDLDLRVSTVPSMVGESLVMRILDRAHVRLEFGVLGFSEDTQARLLALLRRPHGILLVTGPTGSGKTTSLYTALQYLNTPERKILSVEDPVEYQLEGINQIQVNSSIGLTFANTLRSLLRQDPDILMIGEMRDQETAQIAVQSALTGHLVLSTLHTNDAVSSITRMLDMRVEDYLITSSVIGILAQRLVRNLCQQCREPYAAPAELVRKWSLEQIAGPGEITLYRARGCGHCHHTGYVGRSCIAELLEMTDELKQSILASKNSVELVQQAKRQGMSTLFESGLAKVVAGITSIEEVLRVTMEK
ncbi:GspE/PulE family protein [Motiliproteus sp. SC1-56]|uniref:GspE/PulE family protein n=1 Tax=Motiliproteus sp. SC1-56 TaxID=2799565 RepID=UPI001A8F8A85|nr:ATPase, T2SS/T4P/T4SS family [Motiliproteus sp. SC1-56]